MRPAAIIAFAVVLAAVWCLLSAATASAAGEAHVWILPEYAEAPNGEPYGGESGLNLDGVALIQNADLLRTAERGIMSLPVLVALAGLPPRLISKLTFEAPGGTLEELDLSREEMLGNSPSTPYFEATGTSDDSETTMVIPSSQPGGTPRIIDSGPGGTIKVHLVVNGSTFPLAQITASQAGTECGECVAGEEIHFSELEGGTPDPGAPKSWEWRFGDGEEDDLPSPFHEYTPTPQNGVSYYDVFGELSLEEEIGPNEFRTDTGVSFLSLAVRTGPELAQSEPASTQLEQAGAEGSEAERPFVAPTTGAEGPAEALVKAPKVPSAGRPHRHPRRTESHRRGSPHYGAKQSSQRRPSSKPSHPIRAARKRSSDVQLGTGPGSRPGVGGTASGPGGPGAPGTLPEAGGGGPRRKAKPREPRNGLSTSAHHEPRRASPPRLSLSGVLLASSDPSAARSQPGPAEADGGIRRLLPHTDAATSLGWVAGCALALLIIVAGALSELRPLIGHRRPPDSVMRSW